MITVTDGSGNNVIIIRDKRGVMAERWPEGK